MGIRQAILGKFTDQKGSQIPAQQQILMEPFHSLPWNLIQYLVTLSNIPESTPRLFLLQFEPFPHSRHMIRQGTISSSCQEACTSL